MVIFGASGDLTRRKLVPALYNLTPDGLLHAETSVLGVARRDWPDAVFRDLMREGVDRHSRRRPAEEAVWQRLADDIGYLRGDFGEADTYRDLAVRLREGEARQSEPGIRLYYLATPPSTFEPILAGLSAAGLAGRGEAAERTRLVVEKPFGRDRESARALNRVIHAGFEEDQVFRIDHYLGKETVQNLLVFRLENGIFAAVRNDIEPVAVAAILGHTALVRGEQNRTSGRSKALDLDQAHLA